MLCTTYNADHGAEALEFLERTKLYHNIKLIQSIEVPTANLDIDIDCILMV